MMKRMVELAKEHNDVLSPDDTLILSSCAPRADRYLSGKSVPPRTKECFTAAVAILLRLPPSPDIDYLLLHLNRYRRGVGDGKPSKGYGPSDITLATYIRAVTTSKLLAATRDEVSLHPKAFKEDNPYYYVAVYTAGCCLHWDTIKPVADRPFVCMLAALDGLITDEFDGEFKDARIAYALNTAGANVEEPDEGEIWNGGAMAMSLCWAEQEGME